MFLHYAAGYEKSNPKSQRREVAYPRPGIHRLKNYRKRANPYNLTGKKHKFL